jgi:putative ABC transport system permease protein
VLSGVLLRQAANVYQVGALGVPPWVNLAAPLALLILVGLAAVVPAIRAGRLSSVEAIAAGRAPRQDRGRAAHRALGRLRLPPPVSMGLAAPFSRPGRAVITTASILLGAITVTFAVGVGSSLTRVQEGLSMSRTIQVFVTPPPPGGPGGIQVKAGGQGSPAPVPQSPGQVTVAIRDHQGTQNVAEEFDEQVTVAGLGKQVAVTAFRGGARWTGFEMISGRWYSGPGQVDVPTYFLTVTGKSVGDSLAIRFGSATLVVRIVGEVFSSQNNGLSMITDWRTLGRAGSRLLQPAQWDIGLRPGTSAPAYVQSLGQALGPAYSAGLNSGGTGLPLLLALIGLLTFALATVAALGVLNTVLLQTRERVHDLGVFRAVGMTPRQTISMVVCSVAGIGVLAGVAAVPAGIALQRYLVPVMARAAGTALPASILDVYGPGLLIALALAGTVIAVAGALPPAGWAAAARTDSALRAE